jgi:hypothetical protein
MTIAYLVVPKGRNEFGEFVCKAYLADGSRYPDGDYHTDCIDDAEATAVAVRSNNS